MSGSSNPKGRKGSMTMEVRVTDELVLNLCPRVKMVYNLYRMGHYTFTDQNEEFYRYALPWYFSVRPVCSPPVHINPEDVHAHSCRNGAKYHPGDEILTAQISVIFRDLSFVAPPPEEEEEEDNNSKHSLNLRLDDLVNTAHTFLFDKLGKFNMKTCGTPYEYRAITTSPPLPEVPDRMISKFSSANPGYSAGAKQNSPVIVLKSFPSKWFVQSNSSEPDKQLLKSFLSVFGEIRYLDVLQHCIVMVKYRYYDDFYNSLKILCCCSLRKEGSDENLDFEVGLSTDDFFPVPSGEAGLLVALCPRKAQKVISSVLRPLYIC